MNPVIKIENLSKAYRLGQIGSRTLAADLNSWWSRLLGRPDPNLKIGHEDQNSFRGEYIWALEDINLVIQQGEVLGIIGHNGAGKSTLLKILSRVTAPTSGEVKVKGRMASLLEIGTGFHPELTGRENIFLNGAILGMNKKEVHQKFDEIVDFAEIKKFIDTPVKRYSSGMYVRLAFAVAAHLEPEILLVDEVLAVGDAAFQKKCIGKMSRVSSQGRTVLFVSHNMASIQSLCKKTVLLESGSIKFTGYTDEAISLYLKNTEQIAKRDLKMRFAGKQIPSVYITKIEFSSHDGTIISTAISGKPLDIKISYISNITGLKADWSIGIYTIMGEKLIHLSSKYSASSLCCTEKGEIICSFKKLPLPEGRYRLNILLEHAGQKIDHVVDAAMLTVQGGDFYGTGKIPAPYESKALVEHFWKAS